MGKEQIPKTPEENLVELLEGIRGSLHSVHRSYVEGLCISLQNIGLLRAQLGHMIGDYMNHYSNTLREIAETYGDAQVNDGLQKILTLMAETYSFEK